MKCGVELDQGVSQDIFCDMMVITDVSDILKPAVVTETPMQADALGAGGDLFFAARGSLFHPPDRLR